MKKRTESEHVPTDPGADARKLLRDLRKRRGRFLDARAAAAQTERLLAKLPTGSLERRVFQHCEIEGVPFKRVAELLNVSARHLYRLRQTMIEQLSASCRMVSVEPVISGDEQRLETARALFKHGHVQPCDEWLQRLLEICMPDAYAAQALLLQSCVRTEQGRPADAQRCIEEAKRCIARVSAEERKMLDYHLAYARSYAAYRAGLFGEAIAIAESPLATPPDAGDPVAARDLIRYLIFVAVQHQEGGSPARSLELTDRARAVAAAMRVAPVAELAQIALHNAFTSAALPDRAAEAHKEAQEAVRIAQWHGLPYEQVFASLACGWLAHVAGKAEDGFAHMYEALSLADRFLDGDPRARAYFLTARVESAAQQWSRALEHINVARPLVKHSTWMTTIADIRESRARFSRGEKTKSREAAARAIDAFGTRSRAHYIGEAYLTRAMSVAGPTAVADVEGAIAYLQGGGTMADLATAYELSHRLTGNPGHLREARDLRVFAARLTS